MAGRYDFTKASFDEFVNARKRASLWRAVQITFFGTICVVSYGLILVIGLGTL